MRFVARVDYVLLMAVVPAGCAADRLLMRVQVPLGLRGQNLRRVRWARSNRGSGWLIHPK